MLDPNRFAELLAGGRLPTPTATALKLIELTQRDDVSLAELCRVLQTDPGMVGRLLRLANSAAIARPRPVVALTPDVLITLGLPVVRQLALSFSVVDGYRKGGCASFDYDHFWSHSLAMAAALQLIGAVLRLAPAAELFTLGLVADVGRLAMAALEPERYGALIDAAGDMLAPTLPRRERAAFGYTHGEIGAALLGHWGLPRLFVDAAENHEATDPTLAAPTTRPARLAGALHLAARLADLCFADDAGRAAGLAQIAAMAAALDIPRPNFVLLADEMLVVWREWAKLLEIDAPAPTPFARLPAATDGAIAPPNDEPLRILVVDDDETVRLLLQKQLEGAGYAVLAAVDGSEGLRLALEARPDMVVTDLVMPGQDGFALIRALREADFGRSIYVIVLTMLDDEPNLTRALGLGADDYVGKPIHPKTVLTRVRAGLRIVGEQRRLRREIDDVHRRNLELSIAHRRAEEAAMTDVLTDLYNRRYALKRLAQECASAARTDRHLSVLMIDVDHFKAVNDNHGHETGDAALAHVAALLRDSLRLSDVACRFGGEEFIAILPDTPLAAAVGLAERLRAAVAGRPCATGGASIPLTVSIGAAQIGNDACHDARAVIKAADDALYRAKAAGRNRVCADGLRE